MMKKHIRNLSQKHGLPFSLLIDDTHEVSEAYGVWKLKKMFGKEYMGIERSTFLIDPTGTVVKEWRKVKVDGHVEEALETLKKLASNGEQQVKILFSFYPKQDQQTSLIEKFPQAEFIFRKTLDEEALKTAEILVTYGEDLTATHLETAAQLKWIMVASAGLEKMPLEEIANRNIMLTNATRNS